MAEESENLMEIISFFKTGQAATVVKAPAVEEIPLKPAPKETAPKSNTAALRAPSKKQNTARGVTLDISKNGAGEQFPVDEEFERY